jgi:DNA polymerase elongation subunit (family B)
MLTRAIVHGLGCLIFIYGDTDNVMFKILHKKKINMCAGNLAASCGSPLSIGVSLEQLKLKQLAFLERIAYRIDHHHVLGI